MALTAGTRLGLYEITGMLGAGGMGEVYRARDTKLGREVAVKVLPEAFATDPERVARFKREAQVLASLNHPNIAALYGMEQDGDRHFLIMELVEGETIAERLKAHGSGLPVGDALAIARQIADALEAAHEKAVVHRDLKPANVKITPDEKVKVLDFGLAKAMEPAAAMNAQLTNSPTLSLMATQAGMILGTAAYMSPEQAKGLSADSRSDVFSFGVMLYEMLTGRQPFKGETAPDILASVLVRDPDFGALPPNLNPRIAELLKRCLEKNPKRRWQAVGDLRAEIEAVSVAPLSAPAVTTVPQQREPFWQRLALFSFPTLIVGATIAGVTAWFATRPVSLPVSRLTMSASGAALLTVSGIDRNLAITPDGLRVVYVGNNGTQLFVRALDALDPVAIATDTNARGLFVSPDGQWVGFSSDNTVLKKVAITGGPPITLAQLDGSMRGATWASDDTIIFATANGASGLQRVSAGGGMPEVLTHPDRAQGSADHLWPDMLPGGRAVLFTIAAATGGLDAAQIAVLDLRSHTQTILIRGGSHAQFVASGHLMYTAAGTLRAIPFDSARLETRGTAVPVVPRLVTTTAGGADFRIADNGTLVYVDAPGAGVLARSLVWVDRGGKEELIPAPPRAYLLPKLAPDGTRLAVAIADLQNDIWTWDFQHQTLTRVTFDPGNELGPRWTPDGRRLIFSSSSSSPTGVVNLWWQLADGGTAERLTTSNSNQFVNDVAPDGEIVFVEQNVNTTRDLMRLKMGTPPLVSPILRTQFDERNGAPSPDGQWLAYESNSSGRLEIYVRPFLSTAVVQWQVSTAGGTRPLWSPSAKELFFFGLDGALMRVAVEAAGSTWRARTPLKTLEPRYFTGGGNVARTYDISSDGKRFLMIKESGTDPTVAPPSIIVVQHFDEELKARVPAR